MHKQNKYHTRIPRIKCSYCNNQATGIIYRPKQQLDNVLSCTIHATNLFIPFKDTPIDNKLLSQSRYRSPMKSSFYSSISSITPNNKQTKNNKQTQFYLQQTPSNSKQKQNNPQYFFNKLMQNIIFEFNKMKKQLMTNYNLMKNLIKSQQALKFKMQGDQSYPYMIINHDQDMMINMFINRLLIKHNQANQKRKKQFIQQRRLQLSNILSTQNINLDRNMNFDKNKFTDVKSINSLFTSRSMQPSPQKLTHQTSIDKSTQLTEKRPSMFRDYPKTQKRQKS